MTDNTVEELFNDSFRLLDSLEEKNKEAEETIHLAMRGIMKTEYIKVRRLNKDHLKKIKKELLQLQESLHMLEMQALGGM